MYILVPLASIIIGSSLGDIMKAAESRSRRLVQQQAQQQAEIESLRADLEKAISRIEACRPCRGTGGGT
jgi:type II secretory pathway component PulJ